MILYSILVFARSGSACPLFEKIAAQGNLIGSLQKDHAWNLKIHEGVTHIPGLQDFIDFMVANNLPIPKSIYLDIQVINMNGADAGSFVRLSETQSTQEKKSEQQLEIDRASNIHELAHIVFQQHVLRTRPEHPYAAYMKLKQTFWEIYTSMEGKPPTEKKIKRLREISIELGKFDTFMENSQPFEEVFSDLFTALALEEPETFKSFGEFRSFNAMALSPPKDGLNEYSYFSKIRPELWRLAKVKGNKAVLNAYLDAAAEMSQQVIQERGKIDSMSNNFRDKDNERLLQLVEKHLGG